MGTDRTRFEESCSTDDSTTVSRPVCERELVKWGNRMGDMEAKIARTSRRTRTVNPRGRGFTDGQRQRPHYYENRRKTDGSRDEG